MKNKSVLTSCKLFPSPDTYSAKRTLMLPPCGSWDTAPEYPENRREHPCLSAWANWVPVPWAPSGRSVSCDKPDKPPGNRSGIIMSLMPKEAEALSHLLFVPIKLHNLLLVVFKVVAIFLVPADFLTKGHLAATKCALLTNTARRQVASRGCAIPFLHFAPLSYLSHCKTTY